MVARLARGVTFHPQESVAGVLVVDTHFAYAEIDLQGGHVVRWQPKGDDVHHSAEHSVLYCSPLTKRVAGKAIRGGIPLIGPWFGAAPFEGRSAHGVLRTAVWKILNTNSLAQATEITLGFVYDGDEDIPAFTALLRITVGVQLRIMLQVTPREAMECELALHTYFAVDDAENITIDSLDGEPYLDSADRDDTVPFGMVAKVQEGSITPRGELIDRIFTTQAAVAINQYDESHEVSSSITVDNGDATQCVVWNPGHDNAAAMSDLPDDGWKHFVCVEAAKVKSGKVSLSRQERMTIEQTISFTRY